METVIEVAGLSKAYPSRRGTVHALSDVNFSAYRGEVLGIVGPNGSGKTTMLRCALGLVHPSAGSVQVLGHSVDKLEMVAGDIGAVIESPKVFRTMSARKWLRLYCVIDNLPLTRIDEVLDLVGLGDAADRNAGTYSLGMKQRLVIAAALLRDPQLLLLDEPTNGLDPAGIAWLREFARTEAAKGKTILLSSHLLSEVESICDRAIIFQQGKVIADGTVEQLAGGITHTVLVRVEENAATVVNELFVAQQWNASQVPTHRTGKMFSLAGGSSDEVGRLLAQHGLACLELHETQVTLEDVFLRITAPEEGQGQ